MKSSSFFAGMGILSVFIWLAVIGTLAIGWVINLFQVILPPYPVTVTVEFLIKLLGIPVFPIGGILGWL